MCTVLVSRLKAEAVVSKPFLAIANNHSRPPRDMWVKELRYPRTSDVMKPIRATDHKAEVHGPHDV